MKAAIKKSPPKKTAIKKTAPKTTADKKTHEVVVKSLQHLLHLKVEFNLLMEEYLSKSKSGFHQPRVYDELKSTLSEIKHALKKVRKHVSGASLVKVK